MNLEGKDLSGEYLQEAYFNNCNLRGASLRDVHLEKSIIKNSDLTGAHLYAADFSEAIIENTVFERVHADYVNFSGAKLVNANLQEAEFNHALLQNANLNGAMLNYSILRKANLTGTTLNSVNLEHANLEQANFENADLTKVYDLATANLKSCNFEGTKGLKATDFAGADITGATLPKDIRDFKVLENIEETAKNARKIYVAMLFACAYCWLTIFSTSDVALLTNSSSSPLPIIRTAIPIASFFIVAPIILFCIYIYFHLYLNRLWAGLAGLPAIFEDGRPLYERAYPWIMTGLVRRHFDKLKGEFPPLMRKSKYRFIWLLKEIVVYIYNEIRGSRSLILRIEEWVSIVFGWWIVPFTLFFLSVRNIGRQDPVGIFILIALAFFSFFFRMFFSDVRGDIFQKKKITYMGYHLVIFALSLFGTLVIILSVNEVITNFNKFFPFFRPLDLHNTEVSIKPLDYWKMNDEQRHEFVKGAKLAGKYLTAADARGAFFYNADLSKAKLNYAKLDSANLQWTNLTEAVLDSASLKGALLNNANLSGAFLNGTNLCTANLTNANLSGADLTETIGLTQEQLNVACGDSLTKLPPGLTIEPCPEDDECH